MVSILPSSVAIYVVAAVENRVQLYLEEVVQSLVWEKLNLIGISPARPGAPRAQPQGAC